MITAGRLSLTVLQHVFEILKVPSKASYEESPVSGRNN